MAADATTNLIIQGGSLGLLAVVLYLIWKYITNRMEVEDARMIREQERLDKTLNFMQELSKGVAVQQANHIETWKELSSKTLQSLDRVHTRLDGVETGVESVNKKIDVLCVEIRKDSK